MTDDLSRAIDRLEGGLGAISTEQQHQRARTESIETTVRESREERREQQAEIKSDLRAHQADMKDDLVEIKAELRATKEQLIATNGRVRALETWKAKAEGVILATAGPRKLVLGFLSAFTAAAGAAAFALFQGWI